MIWPRRGGSGVHAVRKSQFTDDQIAFARKQAEPGITVAEVCRKTNISDATLYEWRAKYAGVGPYELRRLRQIEKENRKLEQIVADRCLVQGDAEGCRFKKARRPSQLTWAAADATANHFESCVQGPAHGALVGHRVHGRPNCRTGLNLSRRVAEPQENTNGSARRGRSLRDPSKSPRRQGANNARGSISSPAPGTASGRGQPWM